MHEALHLPLLPSEHNALLDESLGLANVKFPPSEQIIYFITIIHWV